MADRVGTEIAGYRIESLIARGGMGEVYLATRSFPERKVALRSRAVIRFPTCGTRSILPG